MRRRSSALVLVSTLVASGAITTAAFATWLSSSSAGPATIASATVDPPSGLAAASDCVRGVRNNVILNWNASPFTFADGYEIFRQLNAGTVKSIATVSGAGTTTYTNTGLGFSKTFTYTVQTMVGSWRSVSSSPTVITTPNNRCR